jgi:ATPase family associated with various cellular activities (AAA)
VSRATAAWQEDNQRGLMAAVADVRAAIAAFLGQADPQPPAPSPEPSAALETLCATFGLTAFERRILLLCAGIELDSKLASLCPGRPTFSMALGAFEDAHWSALSPARPLRYWRLVEVTSGDALTTSPLRVDERILHYLAGMPSVDERLRPLVKPIAAPKELVPSHREMAEQAAALWSSASDETVLPVIELCGPDAASRRDIAATACALHGLELWIIAARQLPQTSVEMDAFVRLWDREAALSGSALLIEGDDGDASEGLSDAGVAGLVEPLRSPLLFSLRNPRQFGARPLALLDVNPLTIQEQRDTWTSALGPHPALNGSVAALASQFSLSPAAIQSVAGQTETRESGGFERLWEACRRHARPRLEGLARRIEPAARWDDLVLPEQQSQILRQIVIHVRQRAKVYQTWGFAAKGSRGLGISALFAGLSGTGKTMAAEVLASELRLDLYLIDLSQVVNKYIGETEKNLRRVFDAAEAGAAVLLFDEADALFGKRSDVKDSHDRYANIEVSYLLQRMEAYRGLAILTTNRKSALDQAFLRRIRFVVEFPFPDFDQRSEIWRRIFPASTPVEGLRIDRLACLNAAGGHIRNIAMGAAFLAADAGEPVRMAHLLSAARSEFAKLERPLTDAEVAGWV